MPLGADSSLPPLLRKAAGDAGFDLLLGEQGGWHRFGVSGLDGAAWITPDASGALFALDSPAALRDFDSMLARGVTPPPGSLGVARCSSAAELYDALRRVRVLLAQAPPRPERRYRARIEALGATERDAIVRQRIGQDLFREMLMEYWDGRCAVTGIEIPELLRASHAKPRRDSNDNERLDEHNGFLLVVHFDALFDQGLMTFRDEGEAEFSPTLPEATRLRITGDRPIVLRRVVEGHRAYLAHHRVHVFRP